VRSNERVPSLLEVIPTLLASPLVTPPTIEVAAERTWSLKRLMPESAVRGELCFFAASYLVCMLMSAIRLLIAATYVPTASAIPPVSRATPTVTGVAESALALSVRPGRTSVNVLPLAVIE